MALYMHFNKAKWRV